MSSVPNPDNSLQSQIGAFLVSTGVISAQQLDVSTRQQKSVRDGGKEILLAEVIVRNKFASQEQIGFALQRLDGESDSTLFRRLLPLALCKQHSVFPLQVEGGVLFVKCAKVMSPAVKATLIAACEVKVTDLRVQPTDIGDIARSLATIYTQEHSFEAMIARLRAEEINGVLLKQALNAMLAEAIALRASDIHLDKLADPCAWISYRVDGQLKPTHLVPERIMAALFSRLKNESGMDASDTRRAQDGRLSLADAGSGVEFRVATQPIAGGETIAIRVLDPASMIGLEALFPYQLEMNQLFRQLADVRGKVGGLILISGPTGSGKTTTLYALAQNFSRDRLNVITVEEPVEYILPFARQIQLNQLLNEKSVDLERSVLRQDPDVLILGEIRDNDSMRAALKFAESGHLVLATVHAKNVAQTFERVLSFCDVATKQEALYILANQLSVVVNQGLIPKLCNCAREIDADAAQALTTVHGLRFHGHAKFLRRAGCPTCNETGYRGRVAVHETVVIPSSDAVRSRITSMLFESIHNFEAVFDLDGVSHIDKHQVMARLLECHVIDADTVTQAIKAGFYDMDGLKNFNVEYLLPYAADADAVRDRSASKHFRHRRIMVAISPEQVVYEVRKTGGVPIDIEMIKPGWALLNPVSRDYKQQFMLAIFFNTEAGLSAGRALKLVIEAENGPLRQRLNYAYLILDGGGSFLEAMDALDFFDSTTLAIMEAGERTGTLSNAINTAVEYFQARASIVKVLLGTAVFTAVEVGFSILSLIGNRVAVLPMIEKQISESASAEKAASIKRGIGVAYFANDAMLALSLIGVAFAAVCTYGYFNGSQQFRKKVDDVILRIPQIKDIILHGGITNSAKVAVSLIRGGVDLLAAIAITEKSSRVPRIVNYWRDATKRIEDGEDIANALAQPPLENSERTLVRSHTDRAQLARAFEVIAARRESLALRAAKKFQVFSFFATLVFALAAVLIALFVALIQSDGAMASLTSQ